MKEINSQKKLYFAATDLSFAMPHENARQRQQYE